ncbi:hypothetical protein BDZ45DRAFT_640400 [Acephala macrosclerotiorum]|nr:hypothetical protein BDZ45DRAFT_640400 [Acephala macrosclerotiorum]
MRRLRNHTKVVILWIDSICINQSSEAIEERNQQVGLMGEVYKRAKRVVVWLGESDAATNKAMKMVMDIVGESPADYMFRSNQVAKINASASWSAGDPLAPLLRRSWFERMWTLQEATLAKPDRVRVQSGSMSIPWMSMAALAYVLEKYHYRWNTWGESLLLQARLTAFVTFNRYQAWERLAECEVRKNAVHTILFHVKDKKATDPKDKVFALYGLFKELSVEIPEPDYQKSIETIYREATIASIKHDRLLNILYYVPSDNRRPDMSSWVPDWNDPAWAVKDPRLPVVDGEFQTCHRSNPIWEFSDNETKLIVTGMIFDEVIYRTAVMPNCQEWFEEARNTGTEIPRSLQWFKYPKRYYDFSKGIGIFKTWLEASQRSEYPTGESTIEAFRRAITMDGAKKTNDFGQGALDKALDINQSLGSRQTLHSQSFRSVMTQFLATLERTDPRQVLLVQHLSQSRDVFQAFHSQLDTLKQSLDALLPLHSQLVTLRQTDDVVKAGLDKIRYIIQGLVDLQTLHSQLDMFRQSLDALKTLHSRGSISEMTQFLEPLQRSLDSFKTLHSQSLGSEMTRFLEPFQQSLDALKTLHSQSSGSEMTRFLEPLQQSLDALQTLQSAGSEIIQSMEASQEGSQDFNQWLNILQTSESQISALAVAIMSPGLSPKWQEIALRTMARKPLNEQIYLAFGRLRRYNDSLIQMNRSKCFFRTANGYFGTAPDPPCVRVKAGDRVALISGLDHPVLLRPVKCGWRLLTHVYLHGIMYGEAWPGNNSELERLLLI